MSKNSDNIRCIRKYEKKDGTFSYQAEVRRKNAKPLRKTCRTLTEAKNWVRSTETAILEGRIVQEPKTRKYTLRNLIERYKEELKRFPKRLADQSIHLKWWDEHYGDKLLVNITPSLLSEAKTKLLGEKTSRGELRSGPTTNRYLASLSKAFSLATKEWEWISENPFFRVSKLPESRGRTRFLSKEELQALLQSCKEHKNTNLYGMVLLASCLGMRFGEIADLKWKNVDFENRLITLEITKNQDMRVLPMTEQVYSYLMERSGKEDGESYVFPSKDPSKRHPYSMIRKAFQLVLQDLGLQDVVFHSLRHTAASHLAMSGVSQGALQEIFGWRSSNMSQRYAHFSKDHLAKLLQKNNDTLVSTGKGKDES